MIVRALIVSLWTALIFALLWTSKGEYFPRYDEKTIDVFGWPEMFLPSAIKKFEEETGIRVRLHYYGSNEEMIVKLKSTRGKGYDLIIPSDYAVKILIENEMLKPLDKSKLNFLQNINPVLMGLDYDPENRYTLPYQWEIFGFGIDTDYFKEHSFTPSWAQIFTSSDPDYKIAMVNDPIEAVNFAAFYLFGPQKKIDQEQTYSVHHLLEKQKAWVEAYAGMRADYLLATKNCQVALCTSSYIFRASKNNSHIKFVVPEDWSFISIENMAIPAESKKEELVYSLLNHLYKPERLGADCNVYYNFPATTDLYPYLDMSDDFIHFLKNSEEYRGKLHFIRHLIPEKKSRAIWVDVKS
ncbi:MAG: Spermidine/putrescine-binding periplasmic protein [Chlamydiae bacterium]|nr:Spermidine/putrescine-binding periplasmic protein [Chlamydiota bacterium]